MIPFDFKYDQPTSLDEAVRIFRQSHLDGLHPLYYAGGTEIISFARRKQLNTRAIIDIKSIPECQVLQFYENWLVIGSAVTLTRMIEDGSFPLLSESCRHIADQINRNKITLGGNICGRIHYREALLPFLLLDSQMITAGENGFRQTSIHEFFNQEVKLDLGELLVQVMVEQMDLNAPHIFVKRTKQEKVDYPLVSIAALKKDNRIRVAFSGVCAFPFRSQKMEDILNIGGMSLEDRIQRALQFLPGQIVEDILGSREYRTFVLEDLLMGTIATLEEA